MGNGQATTAIAQVAAIVLVVGKKMCVGAARHLARILFLMTMPNVLAMIPMTVYASTPTTHNVLLKVNPVDNFLDNQLILDDVYY